MANIGREIAVREGFDETEMIIACLLHDVAYCEAVGEGRFWPAWKDHGRRSARIARPFLEELGLPKDRMLRPNLEKHRVPVPNAFLCRSCSFSFIVSACFFRILLQPR
ncbi:MAG: HD domain-containing protein [Clostridiales bacterium]|nr:HD domain-containing protein [Clostridiales bacterium]